MQPCLSHWASLMVVVGGMLSPCRKPRSAPTIEGRRNCGSARFDASANDCFRRCCRHRPRYQGVGGDGNRVEPTPKGLRVLSIAGVMMSSSGWNGCGLSRWVVPHVVEEGAFDWPARGQVGLSGPAKFVGGRDR